MSVINWRAAMIDAVRAAINLAINAAGESPKSVHRRLLTAFDAVLQEFRIEHDVPGVRYWWNAEKDCYFTTAPGEAIPVQHLNAGPNEPLARHEYLSRQGLQFVYEDRL